MGRVAEKRRHGIEVFGGDGIELVIVAGRATHRESQPHRARRVDAVFGVDRFELFGNRATLIRGDVAAVKAGGNLLVHRPVQQKISGHLLDRKAIKT